MAPLLVMLAVPAVALLENTVIAPLPPLAGEPLLTMVALMAVLPALEVSKKSNSAPLLLPPERRR